MLLNMFRCRPVNPPSNGQGKPSRLLKALLVALVLFSTLPANQASAQGTTPTYTLPECENIDEELLLSEINEITRTVFEKERSGLDIAAIVDRNWVKHDMDSSLDSSVDKAADLVLSEEGLWERIKSGWHPPTAELFTKKVITATFESPEFKISIEELSQSIVNDLEVELQVMTAISASSSLLCLEEFIGKTFSRTMAEHLGISVQKWIEEGDKSPQVETEVRDILMIRAPTLAGISLIIGTRIASLLAKKVTQRIVANVIVRIVGKAGSAIPVVGWIIGGGLVVWDLVQLNKGSVPQIREALKGPDVKKEIRTQIAAVVEEELDATLPNLIESVTLDLVGQWQRFLQSFEIVLRLAEKNVRFREIVDNVTAEEVDKLKDLVSVGTVALGTEWLIQTVEDGKFERMRALPQASFEILRETADPDLVLNWATLSGESIVEVVESELYTTASPSDFADREKLRQVLALESPTLIRKLMQFEVADRGTLLRPQTRHTKWLLTEITESDLLWAAVFMSKLSGPSTEILVDFGMRDKELIPTLRSSLELQSKFPEVLALAESNPTVLAILEETAAERAFSLAKLVAISSDVLELESLSTMIEKGQFETILALPDSALVILHESKNASTVIAWAELAGESLDQVVETGLHSIAAPSSFKGGYELSRVLAIDEQKAIRKLMELEQPERDIYIELPTIQSKAVLLDLSVKDISWLAQYLSEMSEIERGLAAAYVIQVQGVLPELKSSEILQSNLPLSLMLAQSYPLFLAILNNTEVDGLEKLSLLAAVANAAVEREHLTSMIESGQFNQILSLPEVAFEILSEKRDPVPVLAWAELAGEDIAKVVETELYLVASTADFTGLDALSKVLALEDPAAIAKLMQMHQVERVVLMGLNTLLARSAINALPMEDLSWLTLYLAGLAADVKDPVVDFILKDIDLLPWLRRSENLQAKLPRVLTLAQSNPRFEEILNNTRGEEVEKLSELVSAADASMGQEQFAQIIETGQFEELILLPQETYDILRATGNPDVVLEWAHLAGESIVLVVETGLYLVSSPTAFSGQWELDRVIAIEDPLAIQRLMDLGNDERDLLLALPPEKAKETLLADLSHDELSWLATFMRDLSDESRQLFAYYVVQEPGLISTLMESKEFSDRFPHTIDIAVTLPSLRLLLENFSMQDFPRVSLHVDWAETNMGLLWLAEIIASGVFKRLLSLPQPAFDILQGSRSPDIVFAWHELAEASLSDVVAKELYKISEPDHFGSRQELDKALSIEDAKVVEWILALESVDRSFLLSELEGNQIAWLDEFRSGLSESKTLRVAREIDENPALASALELNEVGSALKDSPRFELDLAFVSARTVEPRSNFPSTSMFMAAGSAIGGDLSWPLYRSYYIVPSLILLFVIVVVIVTCMAGWWYYRRRRQDNYTA